MGKTVQHRMTRPRAFIRSGVWLTCLVVLLNVLAPTLHTAALASPAGEPVQICTPSGLKTISLAFSADGSVESGQNDHGGGCQLCPSCPLCLGPVSAALQPPPLDFGITSRPLQATGWPPTAATALTVTSFEESSRPR